MLDNEYSYCLEARIQKLVFRIWKGWLRVLIAINLMIDRADYPSFQSDKSLKIIGTHFMPGSGRALIVLEVSEEDLVFLKLKFGSVNVWKR